MASHDPRALRVLVVEGEPAIAESFCAGLRRRGHEVSLATSLAQAEALPVHEVLVAELDLPDGSGLDLLEKQRRAGTPPYAVFVTRGRDFEACRRALRSGAAELLPKPFGIDDLITAVEAAPACDWRNTAASAPENGYERVYDREPESVLRAARDLAAFALRAGVGTVARMRMASACAEVVDNCVRHGSEEPDELVRIRVEAPAAEHSEWTLRVRDTGRGFDAVTGWVESVPSLVSAERADDEGDAPAGGLARAAALAEDLRVTSNDAGTVVELRFDASPAVFEEGEVCDLAEVDFLVPSLAHRLLEAVQSGESGELHNVSPALAVTLGRLLAERTPTQLVQSALWS